MQSGTNKAPAPNGHPILPLVTIRHPVRDRKGSPFVVTELLNVKQWRLEMQTPQGYTVGHLHVQIADRIGRIDKLFISDESILRLPTWLSRPLGCLCLPWLRTGYRNRGLGSLLLIHGMQVACELRLRGLLATIPTNDANVLRLFKNLGFSAHQCDTGTSVWYRISD